LGVRLPPHQRQGSLDKRTKNMTVRLENLWCRIRERTHT
jgi:hypothetical protein